MVLIIAGGIFVSILASGIPQLPDSLEKLVNAPPTVLYDSEGRVLHTLGGRDMVNLDRISLHFQNAIMSAEDKNFYLHHGVDKGAVIRSFVRGLSSGRRMAGGSSITQQLAKNLFFSFNRDILRKVREALVAIQIEASFSKEEILQAYCNQIPFGSRANGVERAARTYFGIPASELSLAQAALLAGLPNSPSRLNPYSNPENAKARQKWILSQMEENGFITSAERLEAETEQLAYKPLDYTGRGTWFADRVIEQCEERFGKDAVYFGGLKIFTTLNPELQELAGQAVKNGVIRLNGRLGSDDLQGGLMSISPLSGAVLAHVGGVDYRTSQFDRAVDARRRPGSSFKPFLYYAAFSRFDYSPATVVLDSVAVIPIRGSADWRVNNFDHTYSGNVIIKYALSKSKNSVSARVVSEIGAEQVVTTANTFGVTAPLQPVLSIVLGTSGVSMLDMASAYSVFATGGELYDPFFIERVESPRGEVLYEHFITGNRVADQETIYLVLDMMKEVFKSGTAVSARYAGFTHPAGGKTGTTDDYIDSWFTGFTPTLCTSVWVGYDLEKPMMFQGRYGITGSSGALPIWTEYMIVATKDDTPRDFPIPSGIEFKRIDINTGALSEGANSMLTAVREGTSVPEALEVRDFPDEEILEVEDE